MLSSGNPAWPKRRAISPDSIAPVVRSTLLIASSMMIGRPPSSTGMDFSISRRSSTVSIGWCWHSLWRVATPGIGGWNLEQPSKIQPLRLPVRDGLALVEEIGPPDQLIKCADAHRSHQFARFFGDEEESS